jgi:DNA-3-methyladenine glycosylase II
MATKTLKHTKAELHLKKDEVLAEVIGRVGKIKTSSDTDLYRSLLRSIVGQQLSVKAAATIWQRFLKLFEDEYPHAETLLAMEDSLLRSAGLSFQKAGYLKHIALFSIEQSLDYEKLKPLDDEDLISHLTQIKGVGRWTVEMILMFSLNRPDVFPIDDLGIQQGIIQLYKVKAKDKKNLHKKITKIAESWRPHRTLACRYVWRHKDNPPQ